MAYAVFQTRSLGAILEQVAVWSNTREEAREHLWLRPPPEPTHTIHRRFF